jgi:MFS family permease
MTNSFKYRGSAAALRSPGLIQAMLLLSTSSLAVIVTTVLGPSVPQMQRHFSAVNGADYLVPIAVTVPMLVMAVVSILAGAVGDRLGRKRMLVWGLVCYGIVGTAPLWLSSLYQIIGSRFLLGVFDAMIVTSGTVMIGDYYRDAKRERMLALATTVSSISAVAFTFLGGFIGELGWRAPYAVYFVGWLLAPLMQLFLWESGPAHATSEQAGEPTSPGLLFRPRLLAAICSIGFFVGIVFILVPIHLGFLMDGLGVTSSQLIGMSAALNSVGVVAGTLLFGWILAERLSVSLQLAVGFAIAGVGCLAMAAASSYSALTAAAIVNGVGCGALFPTLSTWNMRELPFQKRGFGTGAFMSSTFFGMFVNPLVVVGLTRLLHGRTDAVAALGWVLLVATCGAVIVKLTHGSRAPSVPDTSPGS